MAERRYSKTHEWVAVDGKSATVGISDFAQAQLGDVVFLDLPKPGRKVSKGETFGVIESVKAASDLYSPVNGTVAAVDRKSTRLNSSHITISYAVFCLKKKKQKHTRTN